MLVPSAPSHAFRRTFPLLVAEHHRHLRGLGRGVRRCLSLGSSMTIAGGSHPHDHQAGRVGAFLRAGTR